MEGSTQYPLDAKSVNNRISTYLKTHDSGALYADAMWLIGEVDYLRSKLEVAEKGLERIAKPALGGKTQQYIAQETLAQIRGDK